MNKAELIDAVQEALGGETSKRAASAAVDAVLGAIAKGLTKTKKSSELPKVQIVGFGTFKDCQNAPPERGRNPKTKEPMRFKASKTVRFAVSSALKEAL